MKNAIGAEASTLSHRVATWLAVVTVTAVGALPRLFRVWRRPMGFAWDESYYVPATRAYLDGDFNINLEHPPLGKWLTRPGSPSSETIPSAGGPPR